MRWNEESCEEEEVLLVVVVVVLGFWDCCEASLSVLLEMTLSASAMSEGVESGDWFICGGCRLLWGWATGVENAPVD